MARYIIFGLLLSVATLSFSNEGDSNDPFEGFNRVFYELNFNILDPLLIKPVAVVYDGIAPKPLRAGLRNFFSNLDEIPNNTPYILQIKRLVNHEVGLIDFYFYESDKDPNNIWEMWNFFGIIDPNSALKIPRNFIFPLKPIFHRDCHQGNHPHPAQNPTTRQGSKPNCDKGR